MDVLNEPLTEPQIRILGVLVEKQLTTPQAYPLTENALIAGCNQSTNRYPVVDYDSSVVRPALIRLRERALARQVRRTGERAEKHAHRLDEQLGLSSAAPLAVLVVLMLRGAQTPGELRSRTQRLHPIPDAQALESALAELQGRGLAEPLPRRPGEKQIRWRHLLGGVDAPTHLDADAERLAEPTDASHGPAVAPVPTLRELAGAVERLQERVATLERELGLEPTAGGSPTADQQPTARVERSADESPTADQQPTARVERSADGSPTADQQPTARVERSADEQPSAGEPPTPPGTGGR